MIELKNISFAYKEISVLRGVDLCLAPGQSCALLGKNGSGKTTLARIMARRLYPSEGELLLDGESYSSLSGKEFARRVAYFPQVRPVPEMNVYDYVAYGRYPYSGLSFHLGDEDKAAVERALEFTNTKKFAERRVSELSGGERQEVYLAMLIAQGSPYVILDEPTTYMDVSNAFSFYSMLDTLKSEGKCIIAVMHDVADALRFFDRVALLDGGKIAYDGEPQGFAESKICESVFGVSCERHGDTFVLSPKRGK